MNSTLKKYPVKNESKNPTKQKGVQSNELHAFDYLYDGLSLLFHFLKVYILDIVITGARVGAAVGRAAAGLAACSGCTG